MYQCTWGLLWDQGRKGVSLVLTADARDQPLTASVNSLVEASSSTVILKLSAMSQRVSPLTTV